MSRLTEGQLPHSLCSSFYIGMAPAQSAEQQYNIHIVHEAPHSKPLTFQSKSACSPITVEFEGACAAWAA